MHSDLLNIIPKVAQYRLTNDEFVFEESVKLKFIGIDEVFANSICSTLFSDKKDLQIELLHATDELQPNSGERYLLFEIKEDYEVQPAGAYRLFIDSNHVEFSASDVYGIRYGLETLLQLSNHREDTAFRLPAIEINDRPRFAWRGLHLDVARHFFDTDVVLQYIKLLLRYKMNRFHWHLTDDQGWRIEIKRYPKLTEVGAWRKDSDGNRYGGYYSQNDIQTLLKSISPFEDMIVPEIDLPGHSGAMLAAHPELSCTGGPFEVGDCWGIFEDALCIGKEATFTFVQNVLDEIIDLFPGKYIHIGGDECPTDRWEECPQCQQRMVEQGLTDVRQLQTYFTECICRYILSKGKIPIGWDEIAEGDLPPGIAIMAWRGYENARNAVRRGIDVVMSPTSHCYFDYYQAETGEPKAIGGFLPLERVYEFDPIPPDLPAEYQREILGGQANVWTEYISTKSHLDYMVLPRLLAMAETLWCDPAVKDLSDFKERLRANENYLKAQKINYRQL